MLAQGIIEIDVHGMTAEEAVKAVEKLVGTAGSATYRIRVIHGYHGGTRIREAIRRELGYGLEPKIKRILGGDNPGITELVLREY
ncbi:MAG: Smr/MutS family protein [Lachnospiraceae bacterium]|nr:Smr/MutS family protein [Lachnospiraceae bacterium]